MKSVPTNNSIKLPAAVLLYMLNICPEKKFIVSSNGSKHTCISRDNELIKLRNGSGKQYALKVTDSKGVMYCQGPFRVVSFPDNGHMLSFKCESAVLAEINEK